MAGLSELRGFDFDTFLPQPSSKAHSCIFRLWSKIYSPIALHYEVSGHETTNDLRDGYRRLPGFGVL
jgi:hypothetical protein